jgi:hypothetical protein
MPPALPLDEDPALLEGEDFEPQEPPPAPPPMPTGDTVEEVTEFEARFLSPRILESDHPEMVSFPSDLLHVTATPKTHRTLYSTKPVTALPLPRSCTNRVASRVWLLTCSSRFVDVVAWC